MRFRSSWLLLGLLAAVLPSFAQDTHPADVLTLNLWRVHPGDNLQWASPQLDDSSWTPEMPTRASIANYVSGYRWYRTTAELPATLQNRDLAIGMGPLDDVYELYVEGVSIGRFGHWTPKPDSTLDRNLIFIIPARLTAGPTLHIAMRRWNGALSTALFPYYTTGAVRFPHTPELGTPDIIATRSTLNAYQGIVRNIPWNVSLLGLFVAGCIALVLFSARRDHLEYLFLGIYGVLSFLVTVAGALAAMNDSVARRSPSVFLVHAAYTLTVPLSLFFLAQLCRYLRRLLNAGAYLVLAICLLNISAFVLQNRFAHGFAEYLSYFTATIDLIAAWSLFRERKPGSVAIAVALIFSDLSTAWTNSLSFFLHKSDLRFMPVGPVFIDIRSVSSLLFVLITLIVLYFRFRQDQFRQVAMEHDMASAQRMQQQLLGGNALRVPGFSIDAVYLPAKEVGGDFYRTVALSDGSLLVIVGDVSGKGLDAAMLVASVLGALANETERSPASLLMYLNHALSGRTGGGFVTALCVRFYAGGRTVIANAGHIAPYLNGHEIAIENGLPLGINPTVTYNETELPIGAATVTLLSDGVLEARSASGELLGFDRLAALSVQPAADIALTAQRWGQEDDITVLTVTPTPMPA